MSATTTAQVITSIGVATINVTNQDEALKFYTERLGFEVRDDAPMGEGLRWLTVAPAGSATAFVLANGFGDGGSPIGKATGVVLETDDLDAAYRELSGRGVHFTELPTRQPWGGWASFVDQDGNGFGLHQELRG